MNNEQREKVIVKTSIIGILANVFLAGFKAAVGLASNSIAVILDAVNNLSDALSSIITIVGTKLSSRLPDKKHPLGYGRIEYLSAMIVSGLVLYAGITSAVESVKKIIHPEKASYSMTALIIIAVAVLVKMILGRYMKAQGNKVNSGALTASGSDSAFDAVLSLSVLASALIYKFTGISLEAYVGAVISIVIIKSGIEMMMDTLNEIIGKRADKSVTDKVKAVLNAEPQVRGAYDLILYNYGPDKNLASVHLELPDTMKVEEVDALTRKLEKSVYRETGVLLAGVGVYSYNTKGGKAAEIEHDIRRTVMAHDWVVQFHGFYLDEDEKKIRFDAVLNFDIDRKEGLKTLYQEISEKYPDYTIAITPDIDATVTV
ncbi:MAG: cation diffusion facilitator family transporter [Eubacterium sp.]